MRCPLADQIFLIYDRGCHVVGIIPCVFLSLPTVLCRDIVTNDCLYLVSHIYYSWRVLPSGVIQVLVLSCKMRYVVSLRKVYIVHLSLNSQSWKIWKLYYVMLLCFSSIPSLKLNFSVFTQCTSYEMFSVTWTKVKCCAQKHNKMSVSQGAYQWLLFLITSSHLLGCCLMPKLFFIFLNGHISK